MKRLGAKSATATLLALAAMFTWAMRAEAGNRGIPIHLGDRATTAIEPAGDIDTFVFDGVEGTKLTLRVRATKGSELAPAIAVVDPDGEPLDLGGSYREGQGKARARGVRLPVTGRYAIQVLGRQGTNGGYELRTRGSAPKRLIYRGLVLAPGKEAVVGFGAGDGATVRASIRGKGGTYEVLSGFDPRGGGFLGGVGSLYRKGGGFAGTLFPGAGVGEYGFVLGHAKEEVVLVVKFKVREEVVLAVKFKTKEQRRRRQKLEVTPVEPRIERVEPDHPHPGDAVSITGVSFAEGEILVLFGDTPSSLVTRVSSERVVARVPRIPTGPKDVALFNPDGQEDVLPKAVTVIPPIPSVSALVPDESPDTGGVEVEVVGDELDYVTAVLVDGAEPSLPPEFIDQHRIRFVTDSHAPGTVGITVTDEWGNSAEVPGGITFYGPPEPIRCDPPGGTRSGGDRVLVHGLGFHANDRVVMGGEEVLFELLDENRIVVTTPPHPLGSVALQIEGPWGRTGLLSEAFEFLPGVFRDVTGDRMPVNDNVELGTRIFGGKDLALGDVDGDGRPDLFVAGARTLDSGGEGVSPVVLGLRNRGSEGFERSSSTIDDDLISSALALGDLDGDGDLDLVTTADGISKSNYVFRPGPWGPVMTILVYDIPDASTRVFLNDGSGGFTRKTDALSRVNPPPFPPWPEGEGLDILQGCSLALGDLDGDDDLDLVITRDRSVGTVGSTYYAIYLLFFKQFSTEYEGSVPATRVLLNDGKGEFTNSTLSALPKVTDGDMLAGDEVVLADIDGDRDLDIVLTGDGAPLRDDQAPEYVKGSKTRVLLNDGAGAFSNASSSLLPEPVAGDDLGGTAIALGDLDGDGDEELLVGTDRSLYKTEDDGSRTFLPSTRVLTRDTTGKFAEKTGTFLPPVRSDGQGELWRATDLEVADPDGDGKQEVFLVSREEVRVLDPDTGAHDHKISATRWLGNEGELPLRELTEKGLPGLWARNDDFRGNSLLLGDIDGDSDLDLVLTTDLPAWQGENRQPTRLLEFR
jgi:hypothetical protein